MAENGAGEEPAGTPSVDRTAAVRIASELYSALANGDRQSLDEVLHAQFEGRVTEGLPRDLGGSYHGPAAMRREFWGRIAKEFVARAEPAEFGMLDDGRLLVTGRYVGAAHSGGELEAEFMHMLSFADGKVSALVQLTDSEQWHRALAEHESAGKYSTLEFSINDGIGVLRLNRPDVRNALNQTVADELCDAARRCAGAPDLRAVLIAGNGPAFTVGGDISVFGQAEPEDLPSVLRRMTAPYHEALRTFSSLNAPIVAAVHGAVAGGGLGLLYSADVALAAEGTKFATGFTSLGLSGDGGNSWFLPRLVGPRRAAELYFEERVLDAQEAAEWGLVSRAVPADQLEAEATATARRLADGPTRAYGEIKKLLRDSWSATLPQQFSEEVEAITRTAATDDAARAVRSYLHRASPTFKGQ